MDDREFLALLDTTWQHFMQSHSGDKPSKADRLLQFVSSYTYIPFRNNAD
jgi:hypothetical protein